MDTDSDFRHPTMKAVMKVLDDGDKVIVLHGFSEALVGISEKFGEDPRLVYDKEKILELLQKDDGLSRELAEEHFYFNIIGSYLGKGTPTFITDYRE